MACVCFYRSFVRNLPLPFLGLNIVLEPKQWLDMDISLLRRQWFGSLQVLSLTYSASAEHLLQYQSHII